MPLIPGQALDRRIDLRQAIVRAIRLWGSPPPRAEFEAALTEAMEGRPASDTGLSG